MNANLKRNNRAKTRSSGKKTVQIKKENQIKNKLDQ